MRNIIKTPISKILMYVGILWSLVILVSCTDAISNRVAVQDNLYTKAIGGRQIVKPNYTLLNIDTIHQEGHMYIYMLSTTGHCSIIHDEACTNPIHQKQQP